MKGFSWSRATRTIASGLWVLALMGCESGVKPEPIVVYASTEHEQQLNALSAAFSEDTGIPITLKFEDSAVNTDRVINDEGSPPADILLTTNVADIWRAADEGALRPIRSEALSGAAANSTDPDGFWFAVRRDVAVIAYSATASTVPADYADLAAPALKGKVCLSSSALPVNRSLIAMLIDKLGQRPAELMVRGWVFNRATLPFESDAALLDALDSGPCEYAIVSSAAVGERERIVRPQPAYFDIHAVGVARHARYPESAQLFADWALQNVDIGADPVASERSVAIAGWLASDAEKLAERASYR